MPPPHRPGARVGRALHAAGRVGLARLPRPEALAVEIIEAQRLPRFLLLDPIDEFLQGAGFQAPEDLRDGALGQALRGGDLALTEPRDGSFQDPERARLDRRARLAPALAPATVIRARTGGRHRAPPRRTADWPVNASHRDTATWTYAGSISSARQTRPVFSAAMIDVPLPTNGS